MPCVLYHVGNRLGPEELVPLERQCLAWAGEVIGAEGKAMRREKTEDCRLGYDGVAGQRAWHHITLMPGWMHARI